MTNQSSIMRIFGLYNGVNLADNKLARMSHRVLRALSSAYSPGKLQLIRILRMDNNWDLAALNHPMCGSRFASWWCLISFCTTIKLRFPKRVFN